MKTITVHAPYDNRILKEIPLVGVQEVETALDLAHKTFEDRKNWLEKHERILILKKAVKIMNSRVEELTIIAANEGGKPYADSKVEVYRAINGVELAIEHLANFGGVEVPMGHTLSSANRMAYTMKEPIGVVASISAFNHPLNLAVHQTIPAIAVGSPVIIRPSATTPMSTLNLVEILYEAGLPKGWCQVVVCDREAGEHLVTSFKIDFFSFIGSSAVGWYLNSKVADGTRVALEHGGVAPVIVDKSADIKALIPSLTKGGFYHAGQVCVSVQRIYVHEDIVDEVSSKLTESVSKLIVGDPLDPKTEVGPIITFKELKRIESWVDEAINAGAKCLVGGKCINNSLYQPTVLLDPPKDAKVSTSEIFGPVVCIYTYNDIDEAIKDSNSLDVSFQAAVFSKDIDIALYCVKRLKGTAVMVNEHTAFRVDWMPFGGAQTSGLGMGGIHDSMNEMSKEKLVVIKSESI